MNRRTFILIAPLSLTACGIVDRKEIFASQAEIDSIRYVHPGPKSLTLMTMKNTGSDNGAHTGLLISASQRVLWDPAGTFGHSTIPERNDVHFGITPQLEKLYVSFHSRVTFYTLIQKVDVLPEVAEMAQQLAIDNGPTSKAACTINISRMLGKLPGFESIRTTFFPNNLSDQFALIPGVLTHEYRESDSNDKDIATAAIDQQLSTN